MIRMKDAYEGMHSYEFPAQYDAYKMNKMHMKLSVYTSMLNRQTATMSCYEWPLSLTNAKYQIKCILLFLFIYPLLIFRIKILEELCYLRQYM